MTNDRWLVSMKQVNAENKIEEWEDDEKLINNSHSPAVTWPV